MGVWSRLRKYSGIGSFLKGGDWELMSESKDGVNVSGAMGETALPFESPDVDCSCIKTEKTALTRPAVIASPGECTTVNSDL